jgi:hypothetical protein
VAPSARVSEGLLDLRIIADALEYKRRERGSLCSVSSLTPSAACVCVCVSDCIVVADVCACIVADALGSDLGLTGLRWLRTLASKLLARGRCVRVCACVCVRASVSVSVCACVRVFVCVCVASKLLARGRCGPCMRCCETQCDAVRVPGALLHAVKHSTAPYAVCCML